MSTQAVQVSTGVAIAAILAVFALIGTASAGPLLGNVASAGYGGQDKVMICHKGKNTITVAQPAVSAHTAHGDTIGACTR